jgi:glycine/D-amino acid oxidase-like deaminating enzyme
MGVTVIDANAVGSGASLHGTGMVWDVIWNDKLQYKLAKESTTLMFDLVPELMDVSGIDPGLHRFETVMPIFDDEDVTRIQRDLETGDGGFDVEWISREETLKIEPRINPELRSGAILKDSAQIDGYRLTLSQAQASERYGARYLTRRATGIESIGGRVTGVKTTTGTLPCDVAIVATGAWAGEATEWFDFPVPVEPLKGETIRVRHSEPFPHQVYRPSGGGACPRKDGLLSIGATGTNRFADTKDDLVRLEFDTTPTAEGRDLILEKTIYVLPDLERAELVDHLAGPRALSADGMPVIGPVPGLQGAYIGTGHRNKGIHLSTVTAHIIGSYITSGGPDITTPLDIFLPERFANRQVAFSVPGVTVEYDV